ncbi:MAG: hypothetical protein ACJ8AT_04570 [Hyalangium sp.]|uniref:hypothetical protein n=1 Tax=Hyalangium sp. TaxID=2028555 RepID=UPI003899E60E
MSTRLLCGILLALLGGTPGCSTNPNLRARRLPDGRIEVEGPMAGPYKTKEALAMNACQLMTSQGGAAGGSEGSEYCALHYFSPNENAYYLSYLSDIKDRPSSKDVKTCVIPLALNDPHHLDAIIIGIDHTHPHHRQFSAKDLKVHWIPARVVDKTDGKVFHRELWLFFREKSGDCRIYSLDLATRTVFSLRDGKWDSIGQAQESTGDIQMFQGKDWLP